MRQLVRRSNLLTSTTNSNNWWCFALFFFLFFVLFNTPGYTTPEKKNKATLIEYLNQEKAHLSLELNNSTLKALPKDEVQFKAQTQHISSLLVMVSAKIQSLEGFLDAQNKYQIVLNQRLKYLQQLPLASAEKTIIERVSKVEALIETNKKSIDLLEQTLQLARDSETKLKDEITSLQLWKKNYDLEQKLAQIKANKASLKKQLSLLYQINMAPPKDKQQQTNQIIQEATLLVNNQHIALIHLEINALDVQKMILKTTILLLKSNEMKTVQLVTDTYKEGIKQYWAIEESLQKMVASLTSEGEVLTDVKAQKMIASLQNAVTKQIETTVAQKKILYKNLEDYQNQLKQLISSRQSLAEYSFDSWPLIIKKLSQIPKLFYKYTKTLILKVYDSYTWLNTIPAVFLWLSLALCLIVFFVLNLLLKALSNQKVRSRLTGYLYDGALALVQRNIPYLCLFAMLWVTFHFTNIAFVNYQLLFNLLTVWLTFRILILIARLVLLERISDASGKDVKLYYRLKWLLLFGGWTTALMVFSHLLPLPLIVQDIFNRLFMLFILAVSLVAWKSKDVIPYLLRPVLKYKKRYFKNAISLLVILVPITLFSTAIIGLSGFINLAWTMCRYQAYLLLVLVGYILARGLLFDALELFSEWMISSLRNGWLWIEVFLKPIDKIMRVILFLVSTLILFQIYGWHSDSLVMTSLERLAKYSIVDLTGVHITVASTIKFFILLALFVWASKWTREFCYRWLFKNAKDAGIRNSLSVFSQYAVILLGTFITLHVLGLDFSGMSMVIGGLAVGMGFGLRDFASNIIGGIMLLIERPVREGDLITLGEYEGRVAHIGIRSMRVSSWDNMEVLIPNAETFNKPFTNWTHQDSIVRTVVPFKVSRVDDPVMIQQLILDVLAIIPEIVPEPPAQVFLIKIDQALIEFEARYFINVQVHTRVEVRSKVLFAITAQFKAAGIKPPIEPISVEFKEGQSDFFIKKQSSDD